MSTTRFLRLAGRSLCVQQCNVCYRTQLIHSRQLQTSSNKEDSTASVSFDSSTTVKPFSEMPGPAENNIPYFGTFFNHVMSKENLSRIKLHLKWVEMHGPIYKEKLLGKTRVFISDPSSIETVCRAEGKLPNRGSAVEMMDGMREAKRMENLDYGVAEADGEDWVRKRKIYSKRLLRPVEMKNYFPLFSDSALQAVELVKKCRNTDSIIENHRDILIRWSMDSFSSFVFGRPLGFMEEPPREIAQQVDELLHNFFVDLVMYKGMPWIFQKMNSRPIEETAKKLRKFYELTLSNLKETIERLGPKEDGEHQAFSFCEYLLGHENLSIEECASLSTDVFGGGYHTTSATMDFFFFLMGNHPEKQNILHKEICASMPANGVLDYNASQRMPYLRACIKESQRLYPVAPFLPRMLTEDIVVNNYLIPKETPMILSNVAASRDEQYFPNASEFRPERWLRTNDDPPHPYSILPFGTGARSCVGRRIAEGNMYALTAQFFKAFKIVDVLSDAEPVADVLLSNSIPLKLKIVDRE